MHHRSRQFLIAVGLGAFVLFALDWLSAAARLHFQPVDSTYMGASLSLSYGLSVLSLVKAIAPGFIAGYLAPARPMLCGGSSAFIGLFLAEAAFSTYYPVVSPLTFLVTAVNALLWAPYGIVSGAAGHLVKSMRSNQPLHPTTQAAEPPSSPGERQR